ncbi:flagellar hook-basal body complex protein FliE [Parendozoicomonas haliclonae]|uniref:Flagellar hook-basal body complex protein FliE n=1 Tax=Parendozoicomonas haliclonae TaxID=1960125 RepID=A0A1X7AQD3_9GAMM|nr:flagellar hook-basal body complex protein FliE [Parendozoicomonas haliclonae]SMA49627.1 flagellar hook-basal body protein FliE [Parendozoicomonas haliclonae]
MIEGTISLPIQATNDIQSSGLNTIERRKNSGTEFGTYLKNALDHVNELQGTASEMRADYETGAVTDLASVMIAGQKSSLAFQGLMQVRNRVVSAYETVFNMPV